MAMKKTGKDPTFMKLISWGKETDNSKETSNFRVIKMLKKETKLADMEETH